jgi:hypothetical protein
MAAPYEVHERPELDDPVLVVMMLGWIDAGSAAATAMGVLQQQLDTKRIATFDGDTFIDYRARRPLMQLREGVNTELVWPELRLEAGRDEAGHDVLLLSGHEPDSAWRLFCDSVAGLATDLGVRMMVGLGAYPYATPHTRPSRLSITANTAELAATIPYLKNSVDVPSGIEAALERRFAELGLPAVGLWAQVPHYVANYPYPAASVALLDGLRGTAGVVSSTSELNNEAQQHRQQLDTLVSGSQEHVDMVHQLETAFDEETSTEPGPIAGPLPTGDELAAEFEKFLRDQGK